MIESAILLLCLFIIIPFIITMFLIRWIFRIDEQINALRESNRIAANISQQLYDLAVRIDTGVKIIPPKVRVTR